MKTHYLIILNLLLLASCSKDDGGSDYKPDSFGFYLMDTDSGQPLVYDSNAVYTPNQVKVFRVGNSALSFGTLNMGPEFGYFFGVSQILNVNSIADTAYFVIELAGVAEDTIKVTRHPNPSNCNTCTKYLYFYKGQNIPSSQYAPHNGQFAAKDVIRIDK